MATTTRTVARQRVHKRIRKKVAGTTERPRLAVYFSGKHVYAQIVAGDHDGMVGYGFGKANEVSEAIRKASEAARKSMKKVSLHENTIPHETIGEYGGGRVLLRPASPGTGVIAGGGVRAVVEAVGIRDVLAKSLGSSNHANVVKATIEALRNLRRRDEILKVRGIRSSTNNGEETKQS